MVIVVTQIKITLIVTIMERESHIKWLELFSKLVSNYKLRP